MPLGTFRWKDYRFEGPDRYKVMRLDPRVGMQGPDCAIAFDSDLVGKGLPVQPVRMRFLCPMLEDGSHARCYHLPDSAR